MDGAGARIECQVRQPRAAVAVFDVDLSLEHEDVPRFVVEGKLGAEQAELLSLHVTMPGGNEIEGSCLAETIRLSPGEASFRVPSCSGRGENDGSPGCSIEVTAIFENCER